MSSLFLEGVTVPHTVERGNTAVLQCRYHVLQNSFDDTLYSLKWYKDEVEFYRCVLLNIISKSSKKSR